MLRFGECWQSVELSPILVALCWFVALGVSGVAIARHERGPCLSVLRLVLVCWNALSSKRNHHDFGQLCSRPLNLSRPRGTVLFVALAFGALQLAEAGAAKGRVGSRWPPCFRRSRLPAPSSFNSS
jgi:hypothetical protein